MSSVDTSRWVDWQVQSMYVHRLGLGRHRGAGGAGVQAQELQRESPLRLATSASGIATAASDLCFVNYKVPLKR